MVAQQLTPELTQPNVLVEIDHGPPMEPHEESQRPAPEQLQGKATESRSIMFDAEASTSTFGPAEPQDRDTRKELENEWRKEVEAHQELTKYHHSNIIRFITVITRERDRYLMFKWADGGSLRQFWLNHNPRLTRTLVKDILRVKTPRRDPSKPDRFQAAGFVPGGTTASFMVESNGTKVEVLEGECVPHPGDFLTPRRPSLAHCSKSESTVHDTAELEAAFVGMRHREFMENDNQHGAGQYANGINPSPSSGWNPPARVRQEASFDTYHPVPAPLPATAATEPSAIRNMRLLNDGPVQVVWTSPEATTPLLSPLRSREMLLNQSFNGHGNAYSLLVVNEERVAEDQLASVFGGPPKNTCHCDLPLGAFCSERLKEPQSTGRTVTSDVEPPLPMSWATGSKTGFSVDTIEVAREVFMWMIQYNMMTSQCERQSPLRFKGARAKPTHSHDHRAQEGADRMETYANFASYDMTLDDIDPSEIQQMLQQIQWEQSINEQIFAGPEYDTTNFDPSLSPLSGYASPSSMTTGSTNQSPVVPLLDYDMSFAVASSTDDPESLFPELMDHPINMDPVWMGSAPEGYSGPFPTSDDAQSKVPPMYPMDGQLYPTAAPGMRYNGNPTFEPYPTTQPQQATAQPPQPTPPSSSLSQKTTTTDHTCSHCGATFTDKTKLKVHTNKHTKPFRCAAAGCDYATAEKKSLQRHLLAKSKWDEEHRAAARSEGVRQVKHRCPGEGCTYSTVREDNLKRHINTCAQ